MTPIVSTGLVVPSLTLFSLKLINNVETMYPIIILYNDVTSAVIDRAFLQFHQVKKFASKKEKAKT